MAGIVVVLLSKSKGLDDCTIAVDVVNVQVLQQLTALTYQHGQGAGGVVVLVILLQVLCQVRDTIAEEGDLCLCRTGISSALTKIGRAHV